MTSTPGVAGTGPTPGLVELSLEPTGSIFNPEWSSQLASSAGGDSGDIGGRTHDLASPFALEHIDDATGEWVATEAADEDEAASGHLDQFDDEDFVEGEEFDRARGAGEQAETDTLLDVEGTDREDGPLGESAWRAGEFVDRQSTDQEVPATTHARSRTGIPSSDLRWYGSPGQATPELSAFMRNVYERHIAQSQRRGGSFVDTLPNSVIDTIETSEGRRHKAQREAARWARELLAAARRDLADQGLAGRYKIGITSSYRSAAQQFDIWQGKGGRGTRGFPHYYAATEQQRRTFGDAHGERAASYLASYMGRYVAAPGYSNHQDGRAIDFGTGVVGKRGLGRIKKGSWFHDWLTKNAHNFHYFPYPPEAWHWTWRPGKAPSPTRSLEPAQHVVASPMIRAGRLDVDRSPILASHRGQPPDVILRWNDMAAPPAGVDVVIHLHGYSRESLKLTDDIRPWSGLDLSPVDGSSGPGRTRPTLTILPRGHFTGERRGRLYRYTFPALTAKDGLTRLIEESLAHFAGRNGTPVPALRRLIVSAHSGGGAALMRVLRDNDPQEVHAFDALYQDATPLATWAIRHIRQDSSATAADGAMRVFYRQGTRRFSRQLLGAISAALASAPPTIRDRYRVEASTLGHWQIPRQYGWRILADAAADLPAAHGEAVSEAAPRRRADETGSAPNREALGSAVRVSSGGVEFETADSAEGFVEPTEEFSGEADELFEDELFETAEDELLEEPEGPSESLGPAKRDSPSGSAGEGDWIERFRVSVAIAGGTRDPTVLTNMIFFSRHQDRSGRPIRREEKALSAEWIEIRDRVVLPVLRAVETAASRPASSTSRSGGTTFTKPAAAAGRLRTTKWLREAWQAYRCAESKMVPLRVLSHTTPVSPLAVEAFRAFDRALRSTGYQAKAAWCYNCRAIRDTSGKPVGPSLHSYGLAVDVDPKLNPHRRHVSGLVRFSFRPTLAERAADVGRGDADTVFTPQQVDAVESIRTVDGLQVFAWGGRWSSSHDSMHFQINVSPHELARGLAPASSHEAEELGRVCSADRELLDLMGDGERGVVVEADTDGHRGTGEIFDPGVDDSEMDESELDDFELDESEFDDFQANEYEVAETAAEAGTYEYQEDEAKADDPEFDAGPGEFEAGADEYEVTVGELEAEPGFSVAESDFSDESTSGPFGRLASQVCEPPEEEEEDLEALDADESEGDLQLLELDVGDPEHDIRGSEDREEAAVAPSVAEADEFLQVEYGYERARDSEAQETVGFPSGASLRVVGGPTGRGGEHYDPNGTGNPLLDVGGATRSVRLSSHFSAGEFARSGAQTFDRARIDPKLVLLLEKLREHVGRPVHIRSGYRPYLYNVDLYRRRGKEPTNSRHSSGQAVDVKIAGMSGIEIAKAAIDVWGGNLGIGIAATSAHLDVRGGWSRWTYFTDPVRNSAALSEIDKYRHYRLRRAGTTTPTASAATRPLSDPARSAASISEQAPAREVTAIRHIRRVWSWAPLGALTNGQLCAQTVDRVAELGLTDVVIQLNQSTPQARFGFVFGVSAARASQGLERIFDMVNRRGLAVDVHFQVWPRPQREFMYQLSDNVLPLLQRFRPRSLLFDAEALWSRSKGEHQEVVREVVDELLRPARVPLGATDFAKPNDRFTTLASACDYVMPQAYSTQHEGGRGRKPVEMQQRLYSQYRTLTLPSGKELHLPVVMALAAWNLLLLPGTDRYDTMLTTAQAVDDLRITEIAYWSIRAAYGLNSPNNRQQIIRFMAHLSARARAVRRFERGAGFLPA